MPDPNVLNTVLAVARRVKASPRQVKAAIETGIVESGLTNPSGGDADSAGWRQERSSLYPNPTNVAASAERFFAEARRLDSGVGSAGDLAARVQRPAAALRGRYQQVSGQADEILHGGGGHVSRETSGTASLPSISAEAPGPSGKSDVLRALIARANPSSPLLRVGALAPGADAAAPTPGASSGIRNTRLGKPTTSSVAARAAAIDAKKLPYQWGGGHGANTSGPLDCSAAVSKALGINPRVASDFEKWGQAGPGKGVTIYANDKHVLMEIDGHFWGTSQTNPGGGAGWIPRGAISQDYLRGFTARHPAGQ